MAADYLLRQLKNDDEALAIMSALGFSARDWPFIKKIGGAHKLFRTGVFHDLIEKKSSMLTCSCHHVRSNFDAFYESGGFLVSIAKKLASPLFRYERAPLVFFGRFDEDLLDDEQPFIAIVGSRAPSPDAVMFTKKLSETLSEKNMVVVSGGAMGIDAAAHRAARKTIVVSGLACDFRQEQRFVSRKNLAVIYPFGPFLPQGRFMFLARNRYVAALAGAVVIVQGKRGSGTLATANFAKALDIPLFVLPGAINDPLAFVPNLLLETGGAKAIVDVRQFALSLVTKSNIPLKKPITLLKKYEEKGENHVALPDLLQLINDHQNSVGFEELLAISKKSFADLQRELLDYEMAGRIVRRGSQFVLTGK